MPVTLALARLATLTGSRLSRLFKGLWAAPEGAIYDFDESDNSSQGSDLKPFQFRDDKTKQGTLQWLEDNFEEKKRRAVSRFDYYRKYNKLYKNARRRTNSKKPRHSVNFVYDKIEDRVAPME